MSLNCPAASDQANVMMESTDLRPVLPHIHPCRSRYKFYLATPIGFEPTISTVTRWHVNRYTTGPYRNFSTNAGAVNAPPLVRALPGAPL